MKSLLVYDSQFGNTKEIAKAIAKAFTSPNKVKVLGANAVQLEDLKAIDLLIVGSPTQGGRPKQSLQIFLNRIPANALKNVGVASFDTRFSLKDQNFVLRLLLKTIGYAAPRIAESLKSKGGKLLAPPEGFILKGKEGPLAAGELEKAKTWAGQIIKTF